MHLSAKEDSTAWMGLRVAELFAGVGGFRLGLEATRQPFETVWFNQWEPRSKVQHAWTLYAEKFCKSRGLPIAPNSNRDICLVPTEEIPDHDLLVGGFPCQDYSVATTLDKAGGLEGRKGVLWWEIWRILGEKTPRYVLLENVDRLLKSPARQRGRDFGILLWCLNKLGYRVEWRVINAADYGNAQRRRRTFIFAAHRDTGIGNHIAGASHDAQYLERNGFFAREFPARRGKGSAPTFTALRADLKDISDSFQHRFENAGVMVDGKFATCRVDPMAEPPRPLQEVLEKTEVPGTFFLDPARLKEWEDVKGPKKEPRRAKNGFEYHYVEGGMTFPDAYERPARTILTSEGNRTPNRSTHVVKDRVTGRLRLLTPVEVERIMGFPPGWTESLPPRWRYFTMGNALVVPLITRMGDCLVAWIKAFEDQATVQRLLQPSGSNGVVPVATVRSRTKANPRSIPLSPRRR